MATDVANPAEYVNTTVAISSLLCRDHDDPCGRPIFINRTEHSGSRSFFASVVACYVSSQLLWVLFFCKLAYQFFYCCCKLLCMFCPCRLYLGYPLLRQG